MRVTMTPEPGNQLCISTRCKTVDELVATFKPYVRGSTIFVPTLAQQRIGLETVFVVQLADGTAVLRGRCVIRRGWTTADNPFRLPGLLLGLKTLSSRSKETFDRIVGLAPVEIWQETSTWIGPPVPTAPPPRRTLTITIPPVNQPPSRSTLAELHRPLGRRASKPPAPVAAPGVITRPYPAVAAGADAAVVASPTITADLAPATTSAAPKDQATPRSRSWWRTSAVIGVLLLVPAGFIAGHAASSISARAAHAAPGAPDEQRQIPRVVTESVIEIDGRAYTINIVLTRARQ